MKKLNFGCGPVIIDGWDNVDIQKDKRLTKSFDFDKFPYPLKDNTYDYIFLENVLEHLNDPAKVLRELWRIGKNKGIIEVIVPHYTNKGAYSDFEHKHYYNEECFVNFVSGETRIAKPKSFRIKELKMTPTVVGKFMPRFLREKLSLFINGLISQIQVKFEIVK